MKTTIFQALICWLAAGLVSFSTDVKGGDTLEIRLNGRQVLQQFIHADKSLKTIQLGAVSEKDQVDIYYTHCGYPGKNRKLTVQDEKGKPIKTFTFTDVAVARGAMSFALKDVKGASTSQLRLHYTSRELPEGKILAVLSVSPDRTARK